jgi:Fe-S cluster biosynthesis and repair protein YggX
VARTVYCEYLKREAPGLERVPYPGELGKRVYEHISAEAWGLWVRHQTMLINEYRLSPIDPKARKFLVDEMEKFLFTGGSARPEQYVEPGADGT